MSVKRNTSVSQTTGKKSDQVNNELVRKAFQNALRMMKESGFGIKSNVEIAVDPQLPFMGYSMPQGRGYKIVVSGGSVDSGLLEGLIERTAVHCRTRDGRHGIHPVALDQPADRKGALT